jgi:DNA-binding MarR family transcriptional regulator
MVELTKGGRELLYETRRRREDWLAQAIDGLTPAEQKVLKQAIALLERLAAL